MRPALWCLGALLLAACGGGGGASVDYADLDATAVDARCAYLARCGLFTANDACHAYFRELSSADRDAAKDAGKLAYDGEAAKRCYDAFATASCEVDGLFPRNLPAECAKIFAGQVDDGAACSIDVECRSGDCVPTGACEEGACCVGTCGPTHTAHALGEPCDANADCAPDARCGDDKTCTALGTMSGQCFSDLECANGFSCVNALPPTPGDCRPLAALGAACPFGRCADLGAACSASSHTCVAVGLVGAACATGADCSPYLECDATAHQCASVPARREACTARCEGDSWCDSLTTHQCQAFVENGAPCTAGNQCASATCVEGPVFDACQPAPLCF